MHHTYEPIMQRLITLQIEYKTLLIAADLFKNLERPDLVIGDEEYGELIGRIDEACKNVRWQDGSQARTRVGVEVVVGV